MSTPTRELESLSMGPMVPSTRSQAQQRRRQQDQRMIQQASLAASNPGIIPSIESDAGPSTSHEPVQGRSGLLYDIRQLSREMVDRATAGLRSTDYYVVRENSHTVEAGLQTRHGIQLRRRTARRSRPFSIRIFNPNNGSLRVECTCHLPNRSGPVCEHQYWLYDGLNAVIARLSTSSVHVVTEENVLTRMTSLYNEIGEYLLRPSFFESLSTGRAGETVSDTDEDITDNDLPTEDPDEITKTIQDMLSVFDEDDLPEDYGADFIRDLPITFESSEDTVDPDNLPATIFALARHDPIFRQHLRRALNRDFCAVQVFQKLEAKAGEVFKRYDEYAKSGPNYDGNLVEQCARRLKWVVKKIVEYKDSRAPLSASTKSEAAGVLLKILNRVCDLNKDIYVDLPWQIARVPDDEDDRNLYTNLIRSPLEDDDDPESEACFVIDALDNLPSTEMRPLSGPLNIVLRKVQRNGASAVFLRKLEGIQVSDGGQHPDASTIQPAPRRLRSRSPSQGEQPESQRRRRDL